MNTSTVNWNLLFYLFSLLVLESLTYCTSSVTAKEDDLLSDLINEHFFPDLIQEVKYLYDLGLGNSTKCSQELLQFWNDLDNETRAAYLDSFGKVGAGILTGNVIYLGYYDQCTDIGNTDYCLFPFDVTLTINTTRFTIPFEFGMCFPSSCDAEDFYELFFIDSNEVFYSNSYTDVNALSYTVDVMASIEYTEPQCPWRDLDWTTSSIIMLIVCVLFIVLVIIGTLVDVLLWFISDILPKLFLPETELPVTVTDSTSCEVKNSINEDEPLINGTPKLQSVTKTQYIEFLKELMLSFSLYKTVPVIMNTHQPANAITSINGIRAIALLWAILGYSFSLEVQYNVIANIQETLETVPTL